MTNKLSNMHQRVNNAKAGIEQLPLGVKPQDNKFWDEAQKIYRKCREGSVKGHIQLIQHIQFIMSAPELLDAITDKPTLAQNLTSLSRDISTHIARLDAIYAKHSDRHGGANTPEDLVKYLNINGEYIDAVEIYDGVVLPVVGHIYELIRCVDPLIPAYLEKQKKEKELMDPNVVSDAKLVH